MNNKSSKGFTLIELLVVIAIIGILASILVSNFSSAKAKSRDSKRVSDIKSIQLALSLYYNDNGTYPLNIYSQSTAAAPVSGLSPAYLPIVPTDPAINQSATTCAGSPGASGCYTYEALGLASGVTSVNCNGVGGRPFPGSYHVGTILEEGTSQSLLQDVDAPRANVAGTNVFVECTNSNAGSGDFDGTGAGDSANRRCTNAAGVAAGQAGATERCFDQTP
jgi:type II secretion system protein G